MASAVTGPVYSMSAPPLVGKKRYLGKMLSMSPELSAVFGNPSSQDQHASMRPEQPITPVQRTLIRI